MLLTHTPWLWENSKKLSKGQNMSELLALSHLLEKPEVELTPIEQAIIVASAADEDLANDAAIQYNAMVVGLERLIGYE
jgi:hypothetical protein